VVSIFAFRFPKCAFIPMAVYPLSLSYLYWLAGLQADTYDNSQIAFLTGETVALTSMIAILYSKDILVSIFLIINSVVLRFAQFNEATSVVHRITFGGVYLVLIPLIIIERRYNSKTFVQTYHLQRTAESLKDMMLDALPEGIIVMLKETKKIVFRNKSFKQSQLLGNFEQIGWTEGHSLNLGEMQSAMSINIDEAIDHHSRLPSGIITNYVSKKGKEPDAQKFELKIVNTYWGGEPAMILIFHDVTQPELLHNLQNAEKYKDEAIAVVSHELRTPLGLIVSMLTSLNEKIEDLTHKKWIETCVHTVKLLLSLINSILDYDQIKNQKIKYNFESFDIFSFLTTIKESMSFLCNEKGLTFILEIDENVPTEIVSDKNRLQQIITNLIGNAIKFTQKGSISLKVTRDPMYSNMVQFSVADTGVGISKDKLSQLFSKYGKLEDTRGLNKSGVGLGLNISMTLVKDLCRGEDERGITVESEVGVGTTFTFSIPYTGQPTARRRASKVANNDEGYIGSSEIDIPEPTASKLPDIQARFPKSKYLRNNSGVVPTTGSMSRFAYQRSDTAMTRKRAGTVDMDEIIHSRRNSITDSRIVLITNPCPTSYLDEPERPTVLIVDDTPFNLMVLRSYIDELGMNSKSAFNGEQALELVSKQLDCSSFFSMIILDCMMPIMDGYETARILKEKMNNGEIPKVPIVALTANEGQAEIQKCKEAGMDEVLFKPIQKDVLAKIFKEYRLNVDM